MAEYALTLEEELAKKGIVGMYVWKSNRLFAKRENQYIPADSLSDGSALDVAEAVANAGTARISEIEALAGAQKALIRASERDYRAVKTSLLQTYERMYTYFVRQGIADLAAVIQTAMNRLRDEEDDDEEEEPDA